MGWDPIGDIKNAVATGVQVVTTVAVTPVQAIAQAAADQLKGVGGDVGNAAGAALGGVATGLGKAGGVAGAAASGVLDVSAATMKFQTGDLGGAEQAVRDSVSAMSQAATTGAQIASLPYTVAADITRNVSGDGAMLLRGYLNEKLVEINVAPFVLKRLDKADIPVDQIPAAIAKAPLEVMLAAYIEAAVQVLSPRSRPIPDVIYRSLSPYFDKAMMRRTTYLTERLGFTLPEAVNGFQTFMGEHAFAVTCDHVITFSSEPSMTDLGVHWWAHEIAHVEQYERLGVDGFAHEYVANYSSIEREAEAKAISVSAALKAEY